MVFGLGDERNGLLFLGGQYESEEGAALEYDHVARAVHGAVPDSHLNFPHGLPPSAASAAAPAAGAASEAAGGGPAAGGAGGGAAGAAALAPGLPHIRAAPGAQASPAPGHACSENAGAGGHAMHGHPASGLGGPQGAPPSQSGGVRLQVAGPGPNNLPRIQVIQLPAGSTAAQQLLQQQQGIMLHANGQPQHQGVVQQQGRPQPQQQQVGAGQQGTQQGPLGQGQQGPLQQSQKQQQPMRGLDLSNAGSSKAFASAARGGAANAGKATVAPSSVPAGVPAVAVGGAPAGPIGTAPATPPPAPAGAAVAPAAGTGELAVAQLQQAQPLPQQQPQQAQKPQAPQQGAQGTQAQPAQGMQFPPNATLMASLLRMQQQQKQQPAAVAAAGAGAAGVGAGPLNGPGPQAQAQDAAAEKTPALTTEQQQGQQAQQGQHLLLQHPRPSTPGLGSPSAGLQPFSSPADPSSGLGLGSEVRQLLASPPQAGSFPATPQGQAATAGVAGLGSLLSPDSAPPGPHTGPDAGAPRTLEPGFRVAAPTTTNIPEHQGHGQGQGPVAEATQGV